jgi:hypothetical protein
MLKLSTYFYNRSLHTFNAVIQNLAKFSSAHVDKSMFNIVF